MIRLAALAALVMFSSASAQRTEPANPENGVPLTLAEDRAARVSNVRYDLRFDIPADEKDPVGGEVTIRFDLKDASRPLAIDFAGMPASVAGVRAGRGSVGQAKWINEHVIIEPADLKDGANEITLGFRSANAPLNRNPEFLYALFVPARARQAFPCFDQPDLKARYTLTLNLPPDWETVSNGAQLESSGTTRRTVRFAETKPISTYLFTFAAGRFKVETAERSGRTFRMLHRETDAEKVARNRDAIFDLHAGALDWLERYTGIAYPFEKFDFLLVPAFQFGGMEHPGSIFYRASALLLDTSATQDDRLGRASLIAHETAHMWFGDLVTMRWFNDVWTKEVFANFMAAKIVRPAFPEINHELRFLYAHYPAAYGVDRTEGSNAIRQTLSNLNDAGSLYGAIIYQKAPIVMRQLETIVGEDSFRDGLREYLKAHAFGNATWRDLIAALDPRTPDDLAAWSNAWVEQPGRPEIATELTVKDGRIQRLAFTQRDPVKSRGLGWTQRIKVGLGYPSELKLLDVSMNAPTVEVVAARGLPVPQFVLPNGGGVAYGGFTLDFPSRAWMTKLPDIPDVLTRGAALVTLWEEMLDGRVAPQKMADLLLRSVAVERDEQTVQRMLGYLERVFWKFLDEGQRKELAPRLEQVLRAGLQAAPTSSLKSAWFSTLRDTAMSGTNFRWLEGVWRRTENVPGLTLAEPDYVVLAQALAVRGVPASEEILEAQIAQTKNPDRKAQMQFVRPALSSDAATRDAFFATLKDASNRRRETWVLEAVSYLHHPLRAGSAQKYVLPSLELLREIQRTGDIFFPKRWMDATFSGHNTREVAGTVRAFVAALPQDYPDRLRKVILSSADDLFRAARRP
jgi:aminopeptidase N